MLALDLIYAVSFDMEKLVPSISGISPTKVTLVKLLHILKALLSIFVTESGILILDIAVPSKHPYLIYFRVFNDANVTDDKAVQFPNTPISIDVI